MASDGNNGIYETTSSKHFSHLTIDFNENSEFDEDFADRKSGFRPRKNSNFSTRRSLHSKAALTTRHEINITKIIKIQRFTKTMLFKLKIKKSKKLLYALYQGWKVRKLLQDNEILNALMGVQDINAYIEELEYNSESSILEPTKKERTKLITEFISMVRDQLAVEEKVK
jgi:hypothetical protein